MERYASKVLADIITSPYAKEYQRYLNTATDKPVSEEIFYDIINRCENALTAMEDAKLTNIVIDYDPSDGDEWAGTATFYGTAEEYIDPTYGILYQAYGEVEFRYALPNQENPEVVFDIRSAGVEGRSEVEERGREERGDAEYHRRVDEGLPITPKVY